MKNEKVVRSRAQCDDCPAVAPDAIRPVARTHAENHGHTVRFVVEQTTTYTGVRRVQRGSKPTSEQRFGEAVRAHRQAKGWSQQTLSDELRKNGVSLVQTGITRLEAGTRGTGLNEAEAIAALLGIDRSEWS